MNEAMHQRVADDQLLWLAFHAAPCGIVIVEPNGDIVFANDALFEMFGYRADELLGQPIEILVPRENAASHRHNRKAFSSHPEARRMGKGEDFEGIRKNGRRFPVEIGLQPDGNEECELVIATVLDITLRKSFEDRLRRHEEDLEELVTERTRELHQSQVEKDRVVRKLIQAEKMAAIGIMTSGIGHEINNPLYAILGMAEAIRDEADIARCRGYGRDIIAHSKRIAATVKNLSGYARPAQEHDLEAVDVNEMLAEAVAMAGRSLLNDNVEIRKNLTPVAEILAKSEEIEQVFFNLIRNSIQAMNGKGILDIFSAQEGTQASIQIRDTGIGIPQEHLDKIFDPFFTTKGPDEGEGLGLYIVQQIVKKYAGTIAFESEKGNGTVCTIQFPVREKLQGGTA